MSYAQTVTFAIQAGLRLYGAGRKAYADSARGRALALPLPRAPGVRPDSAENWFLTSDSGQAIVQQTPRVDWLLGQNSRSPAQDAELTDLYLFYWSRENPSDPIAVNAEGALSGEELSALLVVRQWSDTEAQGASSLQTITGTLVNIAIEYFVQTPGAVSDERPQGRALKAFLEVLDQTDFANVPPKEIASGLMVAILDTVGAYPEILGGGENERKVITNVSKSLAGSAKSFLAEATDMERREAGEWLQLVGHAVFKGAAETVLAEPGRYFKVKPGAESEVVVEVGNTITRLLLGERQLTFRPLFSAEGLDRVAKSAMSAVAQNPGLLKVDNKGLENVIVALAENLSTTEDSLSADIFPEVVRLVLDKSADNLDLIWDTSESDPEHHLLVTASSTLLESLAKAPPDNARWKPQFTPQQLLEMAESVMDEVVENPAWLVERAGTTSSHLEAAVEAILVSLRKVPGDRISAETGVAVLRAGLGGVALRLALVEELPAAGGEAARPAITAALDAIFGEIFADHVQAEASWDLARNSTLQLLTKIALNKLARIGAESGHVEVLRVAVHDLITQEAPFDAVAFGDRLDELLFAI